MKDSNIKENMIIIYHKLYCDNFELSYIKILSNQAA
jgi:hypothetical protein